MLQEKLPWRNKLRLDFKRAALVCALSTNGEKPSTPQNAASFLKSAEVFLALELWTSFPFALLSCHKLRAPDCLTFLGVISRTLKCNLSLGSEEVLRVCWITL